jgi:hypothetical protein
MRRVSRDRLREVARSAFWLIPSLCVVAAIGLAIGLVFVDHAVGSTRTGFCFRVRRPGRERSCRRSSRR